MGDFNTEVKCHDKHHGDHERQVFITEFATDIRGNLREKHANITSLKNLLCTMFATKHSCFVNCGYSTVLRYDFLCSCRECFLFMRRSSKTIAST